MAGTPYPKEQYNRIPWTKLSEAQILSALQPAAEAGPTGHATRPDLFAGKQLRIVTDKGPTLNYSFTGTDRLMVAVDGAKGVTAGYGALTLDSLVVLTHLIPNRQRGYAVIIDQSTNLATVFEVWFGGFVDKREVMREIYQGYVDVAGGSPPAARHAATNRVEGKAYHWTQDNGIETLEFYPTAAYSHFVELTRTGGELGFCGPSDYIRISEEAYIYTRTECEFSGIFTLYVMDVNRIEQIGFRLGFDQRDALEYYMFRGHGEWLGQLAQFEKFGDTKGNVVPPDKPGKGARRVYRPLRTWKTLTKAQVNEAAKTKLVFEKPSQMAKNGNPPTDKLAGKALTIRYDNGPSIDYRFDKADSLQWRYVGGSDWITARYNAWESAPGLYIFGHLIEGAPNHDCHSTVIDLDAGLATCFNGYVNTPYIANEAAARTLFGTVEGEGIQPPKFRRHERTDELLGRALTWNYAPGLTSMHLYSTPRTVSWIIFTDENAGGMEWSGSGDFVKIRDQIYFAHWLEEACNGSMGTFLINMRTMHDAGIGYHCDEKGLSLGPIGAHSRHAGKLDLDRFYAQKTKRSDA